MARFLSPLPLALTLVALSAPAFAGPTISTQGPGDGGAPVAGDRAMLALDCQINGRTETFVIVGNALADRVGTVTQLDTDVFSILTDQGNILLTADSAQITGGPDTGKWDCVPAAAPSAPTGVPDSTATSDPGAMAAMQQRLATARAALEATQEDLIAAIMERDAARDAIAAAEDRRSAALEEIGVLQTELAASLHMEQTAEAARVRAEDILAEREAELAAVQAVVQAGEVERAELEVALAAAEAANAALTAELAAAQSGESMAENEMDSDATPEEAGDMGGSMMFDADAALAMLEAAEISDISRAALMAAVEQARANPDMAAEVMARLENALGQ